MHLLFNLSACVIQDIFIIKTKIQAATQLASSQTPMLWAFKKIWVLCHN